MKTITIKSRVYGDHEMIIDDDKFNIVSSMHINIIPNLAGNLYARTTQNGKPIYLHRLLLNAPKNMTVDHINHNTLDNRIENLLLVTQRENLRNRRVFKNNKLGERLISICCNKYQVHYTTKNGRAHRYFHTINAAKSFRDQILKEHYSVQS